MNVQRQVIYEQRREVLEGKDMSEDVVDWIDEVIDRTVGAYTEAEFVEEWDLDELVNQLHALYGTDITLDELREDGVDLADREALIAEFQEDAQEVYAEKQESFGANPDTDAPLLRDVERYVILQIVDRRWREHLENMEYLREGIHLRSMAQKDPLIEYRAEGHGMFEELGREHPRGSRPHPVPRGAGARGAAGGRRRGRPAAGPATATSATSTRRRTARTRSRPPARRLRPPRSARPRPSEAAEAPSRPRRSRQSGRTARSSAVTTRAGAARARSSRSATAHSRPARGYALEDGFLALVLGAGALRFSRSFFFRRRSFAQRTFGLEPRPMGARLPSARGGDDPHDRRAAEGARGPARLGS